MRDKDLYGGCYSDSHTACFPNWESHHKQRMSTVHSVELIPMHTRCQSLTKPVESHSRRLENIADKTACVSSHEASKGSRLQLPYNSCIIREPKYPKNQISQISVFTCLISSFHINHEVPGLCTAVSVTRKPMNHKQDKSPVAMNVMLAQIHRAAENENQLSRQASQLSRTKMLIDEWKDKIKYGFPAWDKVNAERKESEIT